MFKAITTPQLSKPDFVSDKNKNYFAQLFRTYRNHGDKPTHMEVGPASLLHHKKKPQFMRHFSVLY